MKFFSANNFKPALEQLELEKLIEKSEQQDGNLAFDDLIEETEDQIDRSETSTEEETDPAEEAGQSPDLSTEEPGERVSGEDPDTETPDSSAEASFLDEGIEDPQPEKISAESLRDIMTKESAALLGLHTPAFESFENQDFYAIKPSGGERAWSLTKDAFRYLGFLGIKLTVDVLPKILTQTFKGILYAFTRLAYGLMMGMTALDQYLHRRINSFNSLRSNIQKAKQALEMVEHAKPADITDAGDFTELRFIRQIVAGDSVNLLENLQRMNQFVGHQVDGLGLSIQQDLGLIRSMISYVRTGGTPDITELLEPRVSMVGMQNGLLPGYSTPNPKLVSSHSTVPLPGNVVLIAQLPSKEPKGREEWIQQYKDSQVFLGVNKAAYKEHTSIPLCSIEDLKKLLDGLEQLCLLCIAHQKFYDNMKQQKLDQRLYYRNYFESLITKQKKVSLKDSMIDLVSLKNHFVDKVYLPAAIDIHDYSVRVINSYLKYVEKNIRVLTP